MCANVKWDQAMCVVSQLYTHSTNKLTQEQKQTLTLSQQQDMLQELAPYLAHEQGTMRASVLRLLCCYEQPALEAAPEGQAGMNPSANLSASKAPR